MLRWFLTFIWLAVFSGIALAGLNHLPSTYGIFPADIGLAGCRTSGDAEPSAAYYNPAALAYLPANQLTIGWLYGDPTFSGGLRGKEREFSVTNRVVMLGIGLDLGKLFPEEYPLGLGINVLIDDNAKSIMSFDDRRLPEGQFIRYGLRTIHLSAGLGVKVYRWINLGGGMMLGLSAKAHLKSNADIAGGTSEEQVYMTAEPQLAPIGSFQIKTKPVNVGAVYRGKLKGKVGPITADATVDVGDSRLTSLPLTLKFEDGYVPQQVALGVEALPDGVISVAVQGEWKDWSDFEDEVENGDYARHDSDIATHDTWLPRIAISGRPITGLEIRGGWAYEQSPFSKIGSGTNVVLDNDRHHTTLGVGYSFDVPFLAKPLSVDAAGFWMRLIERDETTSDGRDYHSEGDLFGGTASMTVRF